MNSKTQYSKSTQWAIPNREKILDLLCRCNKIGTVRGFTKITLNDEDLAARSHVTASIFRCEEVPTKNGDLDLNYLIITLKGFVFQT